MECRQNLSMLFSNKHVFDVNPQIIVDGTRIKFVGGGQLFEILLDSK